MNQTICTNCARRLPDEPQDAMKVEVFCSPWCYGAWIAKNPA